jgi:hypothetical protein
MKTLRIIALSFAASALMIVSSNAFDVRIGASVGFAQIEADGSETLKTTSVVTTHSEQANAIIPSLFAEIGIWKGFGVGIDNISGSADLAGGKRNRVDVGTHSDAVVTTTNTADAEVDGIRTTYLVKTFQNGLIVKYGNSEADIITKETLATGTTYGNKSVDGTHYGIGYERLNDDNGLFFRTVYEHTDFDEIKLTGSADADDLTNIIKANVDVTMLRLSVGKKF